MNVLVLNAGSSTLKFQLVRTDQERMAAGTDERLARGQYDRIGGETIYAVSTKDGATMRGTAPLRDHRAAIEHLLTWLASDASAVPISSIAEIEAVGHRVTHGGERFWRSVRIDDDVIRGIEETIELAPLHNPNNLKGIQAARAA
jgi:acetate kinase